MPHQYCTVRSLDHGNTTPKAQSAEAAAARKKGIPGLTRGGARDIVIKEDIPSGANVMTDSFGITIKEVETDIPRFKARHVMHGHRDNEKNELVHAFTTIRQSSTRLITVLAASASGGTSTSSSISSVVSIRILFKEKYCTVNVSDSDTLAPIDAR